MMRLFDRTPRREQAVYAEAQALIDDGLDAAFVLDLYAEDATWLAPMLNTTGAIIDATEGQEASYYFEASLKERFLARAAARQTAEPEIRGVPEPGSRLRTSGAALAIAGMAAAIGVVAVGVVTSHDAVPGDWNYVFKQGKERTEYALSQGRGRVDVQLRSADARVQEIIELHTRDEVSEDSLDALRRQIREIGQLAHAQPLDDAQKAKLTSIRDAALPALAELKQRKPDLSPAIDDTITTVNDAYAAGVGAVKPVATDTPAATPTAAASQGTPSPASGSQTAPQSVGTATPPPATPAP